VQLKLCIYHCILIRYERTENKVADIKEFQFFDIMQHFGLDENTLFIKNLYLDSNRIQCNPTEHGMYLNKS
jgi:hypothetical protein